MNQGVIILALKNKAYSLGAFNLALSIKHYNPDIHITLVSDGEHMKNYRAEHYSVFDWIKEIESRDYLDSNGAFSPALAKLSISKYAVCKGTLYIDADSIVTQDLKPLFDELKGSAFKSNVLENYTQWTGAETFKDQFGIEPGITINSSWFYFEKSKVFSEALKLYKKGFPLDKISPRWGSTLPDELFFNAAIAKTKTDPAFPDKVMFFGNMIDKRSNTQLEQDYFAFTLYGGSRTVRDVYVTFYDKLMFKFCSAVGIEHYFKASEILKGKHVQQK